MKATLKGLAMMVAYFVPAAIAAGVAYALGAGDLAPLAMVAPYLVGLVLFMAYMLGRDL